MAFIKATKKAAKLRLCLVGPAGSGKTYSALSIAKGLAQAGRIALLDTEHGSASKYADLFDFDAMEIDNFEPGHYTDAIEAAEKGGYSVLILDSLSHAWSGTGGILDQKSAMDSRGGNSYTNWGKLTPQLNHLVEKILASKLHIIATLRSKMEYVQEKDEKTGKTTIRKVGMQPVMRDGIEYEFDLVGDLDQDNTLVITKSRCPALSGKTVRRPNGEVSSALATWLIGATTTPTNHVTDAVAGAVSRTTDAEMDAARAALKGVTIPPDILAELKASERPTSSRLKEIVAKLTTPEKVTVTPPAALPAKEQDDAPPPQVPADVAGGDFA